MTPEQYCREKVAPPGSTLYYSVRMLSRQQQNSIIAAHAFYREIENITLDYSDISIAQQKLHWWRDEVGRLASQAATHPITLLLQTSVIKESRTKTGCHLARFTRGCQDKKNAVIPAQAGIQEIASRLYEIIEGLEQNFTSPQFVNFEEVMIHFMRTAGKREELITVLFGLNLEKEIIYQIGFFLEFSHYLQYLRKYIKCNQIYLSQDELNQFQITLSDLNSFKTTSSIQKLLNYQFEKLERSYQKIINFLGSTPILKSVYVQCLITKATLTVIRSSQFKVLENFIELTPLKRWWISIS